MHYTFNIYMITLLFPIFAGVEYDNVIASAAFIIPYLRRAPKTERSYSKKI